MIPVDVNLTENNFTVGRQGHEPKNIIIHWWGNPVLYRTPAHHASVIAWFHKKRDGGSSAHVVASYQKRTVVVRDEDTAWHATSWVQNLDGLGLELMPFDDQTPAEQVRETFIAAAETIAVWLSKWPNLVLKRHSDVASTTCPGRWGLLLEQLEAYARLLVPFVEPGGTIAEDAPYYEGTVYMRNPVAGYVSSEYGWRILNGKKDFHAGMDLAGNAGKPVYAAFAGIVRRRVASRVPGQLASDGPVLAPGRSGNGVVINGFQSGAELYGHIKPSVKVGDRVREGQQIGIVEPIPSGRATGPHVHFEAWSIADNASSHYDPRKLFAKYGVTPGVSVSTAALNVQKFLAATIDPRNGKPFYSGALDGVAGPMHIDSVKSWQTFRGLVADGDWGSITQGDLEKIWAPHIHGVWRRLNGLEYGVGADDGVYGPLLYAGVRKFQADHHLVVDGLWGDQTEATYQAIVDTPDPEPEPGPTTGLTAEQVRAIVQSEIASAVPAAVNVALPKAIAKVKLSVNYSEA